MRLQHAIGGLEGLDDTPIAFEKRVFVEEWEKRIFGMHTALMGLSASLNDALPAYDLGAVPTTFATSWTWADLRTSAEAMNPFAYFQFRYYEKWLGGITAYLLANGYFTEADLEAATRRYRDVPDAALPSGGEPAIDRQVIRYLREGDSPRRGSAAPRFAVGGRVLVGNPPAGEHTRLPGYLRGHSGRVERVFEGSYRYLSSTGKDGLGDPMPVYLVRFEPDEIWGEMAEPNGGPLYAELYEVYLAATAEGSR